MVKNVICSMILSLFLTNCKKDDQDIPYIKPDGIYETMVYDKEDINLVEVPYTTRSNFQNLQYTSEKSKSTEKDLPNLTMKMDIYLPPNALLNHKQPLLVMIHGGGYSSGDKQAWQNEAYSYAKAGFVCASFNYRLTQNGGNQSPQLRLFAVQCALEDIQNGIRFLKKNADTYFIDTSRIVVFGGSAGGGLSLINAVEYDASVCISDYTGISSKTNGSISTGATLINDDPASQSGTLHYDAFDSPILLFHAKETDSSTGATWTLNVLPTQRAIQESGNSCTLVEQPNLTHTVILEHSGDYWNNLKPFLWSQLRIDEL